MKKDSNQDYWLYYKCPRGHSREVLLTKWFDEARIEHSIVDSTRSDVALISKKTSAAIEVVVSHDMEKATLKAYASNAIPVFKVEPTYASLEQLGEEINCSKALNVPSERCESCRTLEESRRREGKTAQAAVIKIEETGDRIVNAISPRTKVKELLTWDRDRHANVMNTETAEAVYANARILTTLGFRQSGKKPYLFYFNTSEGILFGDLGGTKDVPLEEDTCVFLHENLSGSGAFKRDVMAKLSSILKSAGACSRFSFYDSYYPPRIE
jgi:hypothetical protein